MNDLAGFSEWTLALLPRLFLYPGGLWLLIVMLVFRVTGKGREQISSSVLLLDFLAAELAVLATAWVAVALLPVPGAVRLPFPADRLAIAGLLAVSLAFDRYGNNGVTAEMQRRSVFTGFNYRWGIELAILTAVVAPVAGQRTLLDVNAGLSGWISLLAVLVGMAALAPQAANGLALAVRLVGWLGLTSTPLWSLPRLEDPVRVVVTYTMLVLMAAVGGRLFLKRINRGWSMVAVCTLAALSLLAALLGP